ncbi:hypothetical protein TNCV_449381 [Trichonephila clavipes]|nr:hypothetical protein TNCV_449381 [Trichonephila clavipes]
MGISDPQAGTKKKKHEQNFNQVPKRFAIHDLATSDQGPRNSSRLRARFLRLSLALALSTMKVLTIGMMTQRTAPWENWHLERGFELLRIFGLVRWGLGGSGHVEGTGEKLSFASQAAR